MTIQNQLRELAEYATKYPGTDEEICRQAADRIDALEAALHEIHRRAMDVVEVDPDPDLRTSARIAREALVASP